MKLTVTSTQQDVVFELDVSETLELENFKAFCEVESGISSADLIIVFKGQTLLDDKKTLQEFGIKNGDVLLLQRKSRPLLNENGMFAYRGKQKNEFLCYSSYNSRWN